MSHYYCSKCKKTKNEGDLLEGMWEGDWEEVHLTCGEKVSWFLIEKE